MSYILSAIHMSRKYPTLLDCLRGFGQQIQRDHDPTCVTTTQKLQTDQKDAPDASTKRPDDEVAASSAQCKWRADTA